EVEAAAMVSAHQYPGSRPRLERTYRKAPRRIGRERATAGGHDVEPAAEAARREALLEAFEVAVEHRLGERIDRRRRPALELAHVREHVGRGGDEQLRRRVAQDLRCASLVRRIGIGMEEADGDGGDA